MRALVVHQHGPLENLKLENVPDPKPGPDEVLIDIHAASINFPDVLVIGGTYQNLPSTPFVPGKDLAGTIAAVGTNVTEFKLGDRVMAQIEYGAFAGRAAVSRHNCHRLSPGISYTDAAAMGLVYLTAHFALVERGGLKPGEIVLVTGAAGGVGLASVQVAKALGAVVIGAVSSEEKAALARASGADYIVRTDGSNLLEDFRAQVFAAVGKRGVDIVVDSVGGEVFNASLRAIAWCGRVVAVGFASGHIPEVKVGLILVKNISLIGLQVSDYRDRTPDKTRRAQADLFSLYEAGKLKPHVMKVYPFEAYREALMAVRDRRVLGKVVLAIR